MQHADHGGAPRPQTAHGLQPVGLVRRIEVGQWLVHEQDVGLDTERARQQHALPLAAGQRAHTAVSPFPGLGLAQVFFNHGQILRIRFAQPGLVWQASE